MKKFILCIFIGMFTLNIFAGNEPEYKEGDIVFQISKSKQSPLIQLATMSPWSHCGIIVYKNNEPYVLEASNIVKLTDLNTWIDKGRGKIFKQKRVLDNCPKINYSKYLGQSYDTSFRFNNGKMYCSELVYIIYKEQLHIELAKPKQVKDYHLFGLYNKMKKRGITKEQYVIAPSDLLL